jgi:hypothetical protein
VFAHSVSAGNSNASRYSKVPRPVWPASTPVVEVMIASALSDSATHAELHMPVICANPAKVPVTLVPVTCRTDASTAIAGWHDRVTDDSRRGSRESP